MSALISEQITGEEGQKGGARMEEYQESGGEWMSYKRLDI